mmetsp:Transcript_78919/g.115580  ORF Transcript_78919/g.115580 Transcript_78919/m.115580 type:complete len:84 (-) Transcript_78919:216-467(-)
MLIASNFQQEWAADDRKVALHGTHQKHTTHSSESLTPPFHPLPGLVLVAELQLRFPKAANACELIRSIELFQKMDIVLSSLER